jgi:SHS2 domain-containing protein
MNMITPLSGFSEVPHTADVAIRIWAPDSAGLLIQAAIGMYTLMGSEVNAHQEYAPIALHLEAEDTESLLVSFLTELLFLYEKENLIFDVIDLTYKDFMIDCHLVGKPLQSIQRSIKAVTYHNLLVKRSENRVETVIVFDV